MRWFKDLSISLGSLGLLLLIWWFSSYAVGRETLPFPADVLEALISGVKSGELPYHLGITLARVGASFALAMLIGCVIGVMMGRVKLLDRLFDGWLIIFLNIPALVVIILSYVWFGLVESAAILAVTVNKVPNVVVTMREGARTLDEKLYDMARAYRFGWFKTLLHVTIPQLTPFFLASARTGLALIWKIVLVVELLGRSNGMGFQLHLYFQMFDVTNIIAYTVAFIIVIQLIELLILQPFEKHMGQWRT